MTTHTMELSFRRPPLNANRRMHWAQRARTVKEIRREACIRAKAARIKPQSHITVRLHYQPDRAIKRRDPANIWPTQKPLIDGLVDAGIVPDDNPEFVTEQVPIIHEKRPGVGPHCWLEITY